MRQTIATAIIGVLALGGLAGCAGSNSDQSDYARVCVDQRTRERVTGDRCGTGETASSGFLWWYQIYGSLLPRYGQPVTSGTSTLPPTKSYRPTEKAPPGKVYTKPSSTYKAPPVVAPKAPAPKPAPAPAVKAPAPAPKAPAPVVKAPAPVFKAPAPAPYRAPAPAPVRIK